MGRASPATWTCFHICCRDTGCCCTRTRLSEDSQARDCLRRADLARNGSCPRAALDRETILGLALSALRENISLQRGLSRAVLQPFCVTVHALSPAQVGKLRSRRKGPTRLLGRPAAGAELRQKPNGVGPPQIPASTPGPSHPIAYRVTHRIGLSTG